MSLPEDILMGILSRLPIRTIIRFKSVSKSWFHLLQSPVFVNYHLSISAPGLIVSQCKNRSTVHPYSLICSESIKIFEFEDDLALDRHELHYNPIIEFSTRPFSRPFGECFVRLECSVNGLLLMVKYPLSLYLCNPITREYIILPRPEPTFPGMIARYGFGISKMKNQYKVVWINQTVKCPLSRIRRSECQVYTIGNGSWRSIAPDDSHDYKFYIDYSSKFLFLNGNLHWLVTDLENSQLISFLDLETEQFSYFLLPCDLDGKGLSSIGVLDDRLCVCDHTSDSRIVIWIMNNYGVVNSWSRDFVIRKDERFRLQTDGLKVYPLKFFRDGDILILCRDFSLFCFDNRTETTRWLNLLEMDTSVSVQSMLHVPSFVSVGQFGTGNVRLL